MGLGGSLQAISMIHVRVRNQCYYMASSVSGQQWTKSRAVIGYPVLPTCPAKNQWPSLFYMASSVSGQDEPNHTLWLATRYYPRAPRKANDQAFFYMASSVSGQDEPNHALWLATRYYPRVPRKANDQAFSVKMAGYWPRSFTACLSWPKKLG